MPWETVEGLATLSARLEGKLDCENGRQEHVANAVYSRVACYRLFLRARRMLSAQ